MAHLDVVRHELSTRIAALDARMPAARPPEIVAAVDEIRLIAIAAGLAPTVTVAQFITAALARGERAAGLRGWLVVLADAIGTERQDRAACDAFAAACAVRLSH